MKIIRGPDNFSSSPPVPPSPVTPYVLLRPMLRAGRWIIFLVLGAALWVGHNALDLPAVRPAVAAALVLYAILSTLVLRRRALAPAIVLGVVSADLVFVALLVEGTGGVGSPFFGFYYLVVVASAVFYAVLGGLIAVLAVILITAAGAWLGIHRPMPPTVGVMLTTLPYLLLAAIVAGYLTAQLKQEFGRHRDAERAGLSPSDTKTMDNLLRLGPLTASELAQQTGLATASITALIDRLEKKGLARRVRDPQDRRRVIVEPVRERVAEAEPLFEAIQQAFEELLAEYSEEQLETVLDFLRRSAQRTRQVTAELTGGRH